MTDSAIEIRLPAQQGHVEGSVRRVLRAEGLAVLVAAVTAYGGLGGGWGWFALLFLAPDLSFLGYLRGPRVGAFFYNLAHSYVGPAAVMTAAFVLKNDALRLGALIWFAHIGFDRALGYGLKYASAFTDTHLGRIGKGRTA